MNANDSGYGSKGTRIYVLILITAVYAINYLDRSLLSVLNEPIRRQFGLTDFQMGLLGGPAFAFLFGVLGLPLARLSDSFDRRIIIALSLAIWSGMTALTGAVGLLDAGIHVVIFLALIAPIAALFLVRRMFISAAVIIAAAIVAAAFVPMAGQAGIALFGLLFMTRIGVGVGEAGCAPSASALIGDYFPVSRRATAMSIFALAIPIGGILAALGGGVLEHLYGWRVTFVMLGLPGVALAAVIALTVREPRRMDGAAEVPSFVATLRHLWSRRSFGHLVIGGSVAALVGYGMGQFLFAYFARAFAMAPMEAGFYLMVLGGPAALLGTFLGGYLSDRLRVRVPSAPVLVPGIGLLVAAPLYVLAFSAPSALLLLAAAAPAAIMQYLLPGPLYASLQDLSRPRMRATAVAILGFFTVMIGNGLGPPLVGLLSDTLKAHGADADPARSLRLALIITVLGYLWAGAHFILAARTFKNDIDSVNAVAGGTQAPA